MVENVKRRVAQFFLSGIGVYLVSLFLPNFHIDSLLSAMVVTLLVLFLMFMLWPFLLRWIEHLPLVTFTIGSFLLSVLALWLATILIPGVVVRDIWGLLTAALAIDFVTAIVITALNVDDDDIYARSIHFQLKRRIKKSKKNDKPGFIFLQIDGLSEKVFKKALENGSMPTLAKWLKTGSYKIKGWETDLSSQTGASQAGILHGCNKDIPAFRWYDKSNNKIISANGIGNASIIEKHISDGNGLLAVNGASITNLFTGDSKDAIFVDSAMKNIRQLYSQSWSAFYVEPFNVAHVAVLFVLEILRELRSRFRQSRRNIQPRLKHRGLLYYIGRGGANVVLRELSTYMVIGNIIAGEKDAIYTTYFGYDEVSHHCGIADDECFSVLNKLDQRINRIHVAKKYGKRPYYICILSDHGQTNGATFKQRYGLSLDELIEKLVPVEERIYRELEYPQGHFVDMVTAPSHSLTRRLRRGLEEKRQKEAKVIVLASGNLGLVYFTKSTQRMTLEEINQSYPKIIPGLLNHEGIGFIMVKSRNDGPIILSAKGRYCLASNKIEGDNPLTKFGENAAAHLRRTNTFSNVPDILIMSIYDAEKDEVAAFEELIGSHGGLGGCHSRPFIMYPCNWDLANEKIIGAEKVYQIFKNKICKTALNKDTSK